MAIDIDILGVKGHPSVLTSRGHVAIYVLDFVEGGYDEDTYDEKGVEVDEEEEEAAYEGERDAPDATTDDGWRNDGIHRLEDSIQGAEDQEEAVANLGALDGSNSEFDLDGW